MKAKNLEDYLWKGLDFKRYEVIKIIPHTSNHAAIIMRSKDPSDVHWCIEYHCCGHYFSTVEEMKNYYEARFNKPLEMEE